MNERNNNFRGVTAPIRLEGVHLPTEELPKDNKPKVEKIRRFEDMKLFRFTANVSMRYIPPWKTLMKPIRDTISLDLPFEYGIGYDISEAYRNFLHDILDYYKEKSDDDTDAARMMLDDIRTEAKSQFQKFQLGHFFKYTLECNTLTAMSLEGIVRSSDLKWEQEEISWKNIGLTIWQDEMGPITQQMLRDIAGYTTEKIQALTGRFPLEMFREIVDVCG